MNSVFVYVRDVRKEKNKTHRRRLDHNGRDVLSGCNAGQRRLDTLQCSVQRGVVLDHKLGHSLF